LRRGILPRALAHRRQDDFAERELRGAQRFTRAAAGLQRVVYLGGLEPTQAEPSDHLRSRRAVGKALRDGKAPCLELRASVIVGNGGVDYRLAQELVDGLKGDLLAQRGGFQSELTPFDDAVRRALAEERVETLKGLAGLGWERLVRRLAPT
jgi:hypothetical protein